MITTNHNTIDAAPNDEFVVIKLINEIVLDDRWDLTHLGHARLQAARGEVSAILERFQDRYERCVNHILSNR